MSHSGQDHAAELGEEYLGPLCRHVCMTCGGCDICCPGHNRAPAFSDDLAEPETGPVTSTVWDYGVIADPNEHPGGCNDREHRKDRQAR